MGFILNTTPDCSRVLSSFCELPSLSASSGGTRFLHTFPNFDDTPSFSLVHQVAVDTLAHTLCVGPLHHPGFGTLSICNCRTSERTLSSVHESMALICRIHGKVPFSSGHPLILK